MRIDGSVQPRGLRAHVCACCFIVALEDGSRPSNYDLALGGEPVLVSALDDELSV